MPDCMIETEARNSAALAVESSALAIDTWLIGGMELVATAQANVEALAARQNELDICLNGDEEPPEPQPMVMQKRIKEDHVLRDLKQILQAAGCELSVYFRKVLGK